MAWHTLMRSVQERFAAVVGIDGIPTVFSNDKITDRRADGPPVDESAGLRRLVSWDPGTPQPYARGFELTPMRMVVAVRTTIGVGTEPAVEHAEEIRAKLHAYYTANQDPGIHYVDGIFEFVGLVEQEHNTAYQVNYVLRLNFEEYVG